MYVHILKKGPSISANAFEVKLEKLKLHIIKVNINIKRENTTSYYFIVANLLYLLRYIPFNVKKDLETKMCIIKSSVNESITKITDITCNH